MALGDTYTPKTGALSGLYAQKASEYSSNIRSAPQVKQKMGEEVLAGATDIPELGADKDRMIKQLFETDKSMMATTPGSEGYIEDPMAREAALRMREGVVGEGIEGLSTIIGTRQKVLGDTLTKGMEMYKAGLEAKAAELDTLYKLMALEGSQAKETPEERKSRIKDEISLRASGMDGEPTEFEQLAAEYRSYLPMNEIVETYNAVSPKPINKTVNELSAMGYKPPAQVATAQKKWIDAKMALASIDQLDKDWNASRRIYSGLYQNPILRGAAQFIDPKPIAYEDSRIGVALNLTKQLLGMSYPGGATMMATLVPHASDSKGVGQPNIDQLRQMALSRMEEAEADAGGLALDKTNYQTIASRYLAPSIAGKKQPPSTALVPETTTSTGRAYKIVTVTPPTNMAGVPE